MEKRRGFLFFGTFLAKLAGGACRVAKEETKEKACRVFNLGSVVPLAQSNLAVRFLAYAPDASTYLAKVLQSLLGSFQSLLSALLVSLSVGSCCRAQAQVAKRRVPVRPPHWHIG